MILRAAWVAPIVTPPLRDGAVHVAGGRIAAVGPARELCAAGVPVTDLGAAVLLPGLVNPHTHLELTCYRGSIPPGPFWSWLPQLVRLRAGAGQLEREARGVADGAWAALRGGVTCVGDISRRNIAWRVLKPLPLRKVCFVELLSLADHPPRNIDELRAGVAEIEEDALLTAGITPHTPYTVPADQLRAAVALATELGRPWCTHWAETREERAFLLGDAGALPPYMRDLLAQCQLRSPGYSAIELLEQCCRDLRPGLLAHFNYVQAGDAERLAAAGHSVTYCPRAHRYFGHAPHPYRELLAAGVNVAIGTDSAASNEDLNLLAELRCVAAHPDAPGADALLRMVTVNAARALGLHEEIGTLERGKAADLAAFPCPASEGAPLDYLVRAAPPATGAWVAGARVNL